MTKPETPLGELPTPAIIIYLDVLEANIAAMTQLARDAGVRLRPHTKIHECPDIARMQIAAGACGIEVGAIERAFCMTEAGIDDILVAHPFYKIFGADSLIQYRNQLGFFRDGWPSYGSVQDRPDLWLGKLSAETGDLRYTYPETPPEKRLQIGERLEIIPNNATLAISTQEKIYGVRNGLVERIFAVAGRSGTSSGHAETV